MKIYARVSSGVLFSVRGMFEKSISSGGIAREKLASEYQRLALCER